MKIAILPGDGIGPEIVGQAQRVLDVLRDEGLPIATETAPMGGAGYDAAGHPLPPATLKLAQESDAVLMGAVGGPQYDKLPREMRPEQGLLGSVPRACSPICVRRCCIRSSRTRRRSRAM
jgi:3-isopropylmalate dehydrogenase